MIKRLLTILTLSITTLFCGCNAWNDVLTNEAKLEAICTTTQGVAQTTVSLVVAKNPDLKQWFLLGSEAIQMAVNNGTIKPTELNALVKQALDKNHCDEAIAATVIASMDTILNLYSIVYQVNIESQMNDIAKSYVKILQSACKGIDAACGKITTDTAALGEELSQIKFKAVNSYTIEELRL